MKGITRQIEQYKTETGVTYIESFLDFCEEKEIDPTEVIHEVDKPLFNKIKAEFEEKGFYIQKKESVKGNIKYKFVKQTSHLDDEF